MREGDREVGHVTVCLRERESVRQGAHVSACVRDGETERGRERFAV